MVSYVTEVDHQSWINFSPLNIPMSNFQGNEARARCNAGIINFSAGAANPLSFGSIFRPRAVRPCAAPGFGSNNSPTSPDSPDRQDWLPVQMSDSSPR